jgi:hypothetical protein
MTSTLKKAAIAWLAAATAPIPAWSGASLGTFSELAQEVGFSLSINPTPNGRRLGLGPGAGAAASSGRFSGDIRRGLYFFEYSTNLEHLVFNEFQNANLGGDPKVFSQLKRPGPYRFQEKATSAFLGVVSGVTLPLPRFSVQTKRI